MRFIKALCVMYLYQCILRSQKSDFSLHHVELRQMMSPSRVLCSKRWAEIVHLGESTATNENNEK
jgi:hypothetical protein